MMHGGPRPPPGLAEAKARREEGERKRREAEAWSAYKADDDSVYYYNQVLLHCAVPQKAHAVRPACSLGGRVGAVPALCHCEAPTRRLCGTSLPPSLPFHS